MSDTERIKCQVTAVEVGATVHVLVKFVAAAVTGPSRRPPLHLSLVLDRSGSMMGAKLEHAKAAAVLVVERLAPTDLVGLVAFESQVQTLAQPQHPAWKAPLLAAIAQLHTGGGTNLSGGWLRGVEQLRQARTPDSMNRLLLLSDGAANQGIVDPQLLTAAARDAKDQSGVITTTLGFGQDFNETLLQGMAAAAGGNFHYIEQPDDAPKVFAAELGDLRNLAAQNIAVELRPTAAVKAWRQVTGYPELASEEGRLFELGDVVGGEEKRLLLTLDVPNLERLGAVKVLDLCARFVEVSDASLATKSIAQELLVNVLSEAQAGAQGQRLEILQELALQESARARREAVQAGNSPDRIIARLRQAADALAALPEAIRRGVVDGEIAALRQQAGDIEHLRHEMSDPQTTNLSRKRLLSEAHWTETGRLDTIRLGRAMWARSASPKPPPAAPPPAAPPPAKPPPPPPTGRSDTPPTEPPAAAPDPEP